MTKKSIPTKGLAVRSSYISHTRRGEFWVYDIETGQLVAHKRLKNVITSDNMIALLAVCKACEFCIENNYIENVYCSNGHSHKWARNKQFNTNASSPGMIKLVSENMETLERYNVNELVILWDPAWGRMKDYIYALVKKNVLIDDLPF